MARGLAIETSGRVGSVAVVRDGRVVVEEAFEHGFKHATELLPMVDRLVRGQGWTPRDVEELYVSAGPGSFTGLRIGITLAKTMALATGVQVVAVPTVRVLAENAPADATDAIIVLDAKRDQIFTARFERNAGGQWAEREAAHLDSLVAMLGRAPRPVWLIGEGIPHHEKFLSKDDPGVVVTAPEAWRARATAVANIGSAMADRGEWADPYKLTPVYIRRPEAEEKWEQARGG
jgi:tRNA threonylcarbamoyladenosine biosynthesis protein TsaB